ncbi:MAG: hypothetical protein JWM55_1311 [Acidimicrobiaceae bacterium]|nr:hypothetical protein [Acidimicrobiaceae bacterium]
MKEKENRSLRRLVVCAFLVGVLIPAGAMAAFAAQADSNWKDTRTVDGYSYENQASVNNTGTDAVTMNRPGYSGGSFDWFSHAALARDWSA